MLVLPIGPHDTVELFSLSSGRRGALFSGQFTGGTRGRHISGEHDLSTGQKLRDPGHVVD
jgi:hypothetical protein